MSGASSSGIQLATHGKNNAASCFGIQRVSRQEWLKEMRGWLMVTATLAAGITYQSGLNPPGGFWQQDDSQGHLAGYPVLYDKLASRYLIFFFCNATSFITSLVIILLLTSPSFHHTETQLNVLKVTMVLDLVGLMGAFAAGSSRKLKWSIYVFLLVVGVFCYVVYLAKLGLGPPPQPNAQPPPPSTNAPVQ